MAVPSRAEVWRRETEAAKLDVSYTSVAKTLRDAKCVECHEDLDPNTAEECAGCGHNTCWDECADKHVCVNVEAEAAG
jgi:hypothetical protein